MTIVTAGAFSLSVSDNISSVSAAYQDYQNNPTNGHLVTYQAALANAAAALTSLVTPEGAEFAANALVGDAGI